MEPRQTYESLDAQAFKDLNTKIEDEFLAGAVNNLTAMVWTPYKRRNLCAAKAWLHDKYYMNIKRDGLLIKVDANITAFLHNIIS